MDGQDFLFTIDGKPIEVLINKIAKQSDGSCLVRLGDTEVLVTAVAAKEPKEDTNFLPLTVDYRERTYAAGKIPGGFFKREGRPREKEILISRLIDRSIRPIFSEYWNNETQIVVLVLSTDNENDADIISINGASMALLVSDIPFCKPVGAVRIGKIDGEFVINPTISQLSNSTLDMVVAGTIDGLVMVEAGMCELPESEVLKALEIAHKEIKNICEFQKTLPKKDKIIPTSPQISENIINRLNSYSDRIDNIIVIKDKKSRENEWNILKKEVLTNLLLEFPNDKKNIEYILDDMLYKKARRLILDKKIRPDGRTYDQIRDIDCQVGVLPRTHGSALFTRGQTQALVTLTLGNPDDMQIMDELGGEYKERFMLHYNFPGFATGEARPDKSPGRREIGHGALARRSLYPLLPSTDDFPYAIRIVSDILESNGSSSMASVCGGSLAFFDAGVPIKSSCAGIAMGLIKEDDRYAILTDIMGMEDHLGDMDFKVAGTKTGITALQMDLKISGVSYEILSKALEQARDARLFVLDKMDEVISSPRKELSIYAPRMSTIFIPPNKIGELIGAGGKNIRRIQEESGAEITIEDNGRIFISSSNKEAVDLAKQMVEYYTADVEVGKIYKGKVTRIVNFGAFVEILPGKEGLVHISQISDHHIKKVEDVLSENDDVMVKVIEIDNQGRINLSMKGIPQDKNN